MIEALKLVGAISGLISLGWNLWDRILKNWPSTRLEAGDRAAVLVVSNPSADSIIVSFEAKPAGFWVRQKREDGNLRAFQDAALSSARGEKAPLSDRDIVIGPNAEEKFYVGCHNFPSDDNLSVRLRLAWRFPQRRAIPKRPVTIATTVRDLRLLQQETER